MAGRANPPRIYFCGQSGRCRSLISRFQKDFDVARADEDLFAGVELQILRAGAGEFGLYLVALVVLKFDANQGADARDVFAAVVELVARQIGLSVERGRDRYGL